MHMRIVRTVRPYLIKNGQPTGVVKKLCETPKGRAVIRAMWNYYASVMSQKFDCSDWKLDTNIDIQNYRYDTFHYVNKLRRAGL